MWLLCVFLPHCFTGATVDSNFSSRAQYRLHDYLFQSYNAMLRPSSNLHEPTAVGLEYELSAVVNLDEVSEVMTTLGFLVVEWHDELLHWDIEDYENLTYIVVPAYKVWLPDCGIQNSVTKFTDSRYWEDFRVEISYTGKILWKFGGIFETSCTLDMTFYPFDLQKCDIIVENWAYTIDSVNLTNILPEIHLHEFSENGGWQLDHTAATFSTYTEDTHPGDLFPKVTFSIFIARKFRYYLMNIILPAMFVIVIALVVFWLPPDSGEKVSLGVTVLLAFSVFQLVIMEHTPRSSDYTPLMTLLFTIIMGTATFSVLTSVLVLYFHHHGVETRPPRFVRYVAFKILAKIFCMQSQVADAKSTMFNRSKKKDENKVEQKDITTEIQILPLKKILQNNFVGGNNGTAQEKQSPCIGAAVTGDFEQYLKQILECILELRENHRKKLAEQSILDEWKALCLIVDRTMFWFAFVVLMVSIPTILFARDSGY